MNIKGVKIYDLKSIAEWQLQKQENVFLPPLQRSFVWKPSQIENLWDSLFRGYPIGSLLLSQDKSKAINESLELLDGQQRSTAIFLGFYNPWSNETPENLWKLQKASLPILWFDLGCLKNEKGTSKFLFRLITKSHPWGYQKSDNSKVLLTPDITKALEHYDLGEKRYYNASLKKFWPWDSKVPVPVSFIFESYSEHQKKETKYSSSWTDSLYHLCSKKIGKTVTKDLKDITYLKELKSILEDEDCNKHLYNIIHNLMSRGIPALLTPEGYLKNNYDDQHQATGTDVDAENTLNLFVRVNSGGTPLAGEELIFSMYKSYYPEFQAMIQGSAIDYIRPSRILTFAIKMAYAIYQKENNKLERSPGKTKVKDFKRFVKDEPLMEKLKGFIASLHKCDVFLEAKKILSGNESFQLSYASLTNLVEKSPDVVFILLYRIYNKDQIKIGSDNHKKVIGFLTSLSWFGKSEKQNSGDSVLRHIWKSMIEANQKDFWTAEVMLGAMRAKDAKVKVPQMLNPDVLRSHLLEHAVNVRLEELKTKKVPQDLLDFYGNEAIAVNSWSRFVKKLMQEKNLILFSQKQFIDLWFREHIMTDLEDTNVPWDWDHIYPSNMTKNVVSTRLPFLMDWHSSNGNYRAWPYELNRGDGAKDPSAKFRLDQNDDKVLKYLKDGEVFKASAIKNEKDWSDITKKCENDLELQNIQKVVINRLCDLYQHWYETLYIAELFPATRLNILTNDAKEIEDLIEIPPSFKISKSVNDEDDFEIWYKHENLSTNFTLVYYINIDKKNLLHTDSDNDVIGLYLELKDPKLSKSALKDACGKSLSYKLESDEKGAYIYKTTAYRGLSKDISRELQEFIKDTEEIYASLIVNNQIKKAS